MTAPTPGVGVDGRVFLRQGRPRAADHGQPGQPGDAKRGAGLQSLANELPPIEPPEVAIGAKLLQLPSGVGVLPVRTLSWMSVPAGVFSIQLSWFQLTAWPASKMRDSKAPDAG